MEIAVAIVLALFFWAIWQIRNAPRMTSEDDRNVPEPIRRQSLLDAGPEFDAFLTYYYRSPAPERVPEAVRWFAASPLVEDPLTRAPIAYFFARLAQEHPAIFRDYDAVLQNAPPTGKSFIKEIFLGRRNSPPGPVNALDRVVQTPTDNDLLWAEFSLTGKIEPVLRLIDVLEWPDCVREKLEEWLALRSSVSNIDRTETLPKRASERLQEVIGIVCDPPRQQIETAEDLDCLCLMRGVDMASPERFTQVRHALPFDLSAEVALRMHIKASAKWSLAGYAKRHSLVLETCEREIVRRKGNARLALLEIAAAARFDRGDYTAAAKWIQNFLQLNPSHRDMLEWLPIAESEGELDRVSELLGEKLPTQEFALDQPSEAARTCADKFEAAKTYFSRIIFRDRTEESMKQRDYVTIEWKFRFQAADRFHVKRQAFKSEDYDEWVSIGRETYLYLGSWIRTEDQFHEADSHLVRGELWLETLRSAKPVSGGAYDYRGQRYWLLDFETDDFGHLVPFNSILAEPLDISGNIRIWIEASTNLLAKAELSLDGRSSDGNDVHIDYQQVFAAYNCDTRIDSPATYSILES